MTDVLELNRFPAPPIVRGCVLSKLTVLPVGRRKELPRRRARYDHPIVGVTSEAVVEPVKERPPIVPLDDCIQHPLAHPIQADDDERFDKFYSWRGLPLHVVCKGVDWGAPSRCEMLVRHLAGVTVRYVHLFQTIQTSSTQLSKTISEPTWPREPGAVVVVAGAAIRTLGLIGETTTTPQVAATSGS